MVAKNKNKTIGAVAYVDEVLGELTQQAPKALVRGEGTAVHRARVATRRLGAALEVLGPLIESHQMRLMTKALKRIRRSVQDMRDLDVMQEHLQQWENGSHAEAAGRVRRKMESERSTIQEEVAKQANVEKWLASVGYWLAIRGGLFAQREQVQGLVISSLRGQFATFAAQADRLSEALKCAQEHEIQPHALRIAGKSLRYTFEIARMQRLGVAMATLRRFKQLQDALGLWHDYHVLTQKVLQVTLDEMERAEYHGDEGELIRLGADLLRSSHVQLQQFARLWFKHRQWLTDELGKVTGQQRTVTQAAASVEQKPHAQENVAPPAAIAAETTTERAE